MKRLVFFLVLMLSIAGFSNSTGNQNNAIASVTEKFMNDYLNDNISTENWLAAQPVTANFRKIYRERVKSLNLADRLLNEEIKESQLSSSDKNLLKKYQGIEYDALLGSLAGDINSSYSKFKLKNWNAGTGVATLIDTIDSEHAVGECTENASKQLVCNPINAEISIKLIQSNGKWLIGGAGSVNMK